MTLPAVQASWPGWARATRRRHPRWPAVALLLGLAGNAGHAQNVSQVDDLFTGVGSDPSSMDLASNGVLGGNTYFAARGNDAGKELWVTDGTAAGTRRFADICPGACSSTPSDFYVEAGRLYFSATDGRHGRELWMLASGAPAPVMVADIHPGAGSSSPANFVRVNLRINSLTVQRTYFTANDPLRGRELWRLNAASGTVALEADIEPGPSSSNPLVIGQLGPVGANTPRALLLATRTPVGRQPFVLNYTSIGLPPASVDLLHALVANGTTSSATTLNGFAVFVATNTSAPSAQRQELWVSQGSGANTVLLMSGSSIGAPVAHPGLDRVFFPATVASDRELYATDGDVSGSGTGRVKDIRIGGSSNPEGLAVRGDHLLFLANDGVTGRELWRSDGTSVGTVLVAEVVPGSEGIETGFQTAPVASADGSRVYFGHLGQLWRSDGTAVGTSLVRTLVGGTMHSLRPTSLARVLISQNAAGLEPFFSDGTSAGTVQLGNFMTGIGHAHPETTAPLGARMLFSAISDDGAGARDMWSTLGSPGDPQPFHPLEVHGIGYLGNRLLAGRRNDDDYVFTDGTLANTAVFAGPRLVPLLGALGAPSFGCAAELAGNLYFVGEASSADGPELFRSDGTPAGTVAVTDLSDAGDDAFEMCVENDGDDILTLNGQVLFQAHLNDSTGMELLRSNGVDPPQLVADINPGPDDSRIRHMTRVGDRAVFVAFNPVHGFEPWVTDGTAQGTRLLMDITPGPVSSNAANFVTVGAQAFFVASSPAAGRELWVTDGTPAGTRMVIDLYPGPGDAFGHVALVGGARRAFFAATTPDLDPCPLFMSDGTAAGTQCAITVQPTGNALLPARELAALDNGAIALVAWSPGEGEEIRAWRGGAATLPLNGHDIRPGAAGSEPLRLQATASGRLFFSADDGSTGRELWTLDLSDFLFTDNFD